MKSGTRVGISILAFYFTVKLAGLVGYRLGKANASSPYGQDYFWDDPQSPLNSWPLNSAFFAWLMILAIVGFSAFYLWRLVSQFIQKTDPIDNESEKSDSPSEWSLPAWIYLLLMLIVMFTFKSARDEAFEAKHETLNQQSTDDMSLQKSFDRMTPQQYQAILKMMSPQKRQESIESLSRSQRERLLPN